MVVLGEGGIVWRRVAWWCGMGWGGLGWVGVASCGIECDGVGCGVGWQADGVEFRVVPCGAGQHVVSWGCHGAMWCGVDGVA